MKFRVGKVPNFGNDQRLQLVRPLRPFLPYSNEFGLIVSGSRVSRGGGRGQDLRRVPPRGTGWRAIGWFLEIDTPGFDLEVFTGASGPSTTSSACYRGAVVHSDLLSVPDLFALNECRSTGLSGWTDPSVAKHDDLAIVKKPTAYGRRRYRRMPRCENRIRFSSGGAAKCAVKTCCCGVWRVVLN